MRTLALALLGLLALAGTAVSMSDPTEALAGVQDLGECFLGGDGCGALE
jgi:hypothetical protein